mgnify:CR=1 FL=1
MSIRLTKKLLPAAIMLAVSSTSVQAANWLMLQGTEKQNQAPRAKVWGFIQAEYQQTDDTKLPSGKPAAFNQNAPDLTSASGFNIRRARIGVRGNNLPIDSKVNYFLLTEFGNNGITTGKGGSKGQLTDASITLNHIPGARVRVGLFKTPGSEEGLQAIGVHNYVNFTNATNRLLLERFFDKSTGNTERDGPVGAFRDIGVQVFDSFNLAGWDTSYAIMYGNGHGITADDNKHKDLYLYASTEKVLGKAGPRRHGLKFYAWNQSGKRTLADVGDKDRTRSGLGTTFWNGKYRFAAEYIQADGMIFAGTKGANTPDNGGTFNVQPDQKADGYYFDFGYRVIPNLELNARYDFLNSGTEKDSNSGTNKDAKREFTTTTLGAQYFINKKTTLMANYEIRDIKAPDAPSAAPVHDIVEAIDNRISLQLRVVF